MTCERMQRLMGVYAEAGRAERMALSEHLRGCPHCQAAWAEEQRVQRYIHTFPNLEAPAGLERRLIGLLKPPPAPPGPGGWWQNVAALVSGVLVLMATTYGVLENRTPASQNGIGANTNMEVASTGEDAMAMAGQSSADRPSSSAPILRQKPIDLLVAALPPAAAAAEPEVLPASARPNPASRRPRPALPAQFATAEPPASAPQAQNGETEENGDDDRQVAVSNPPPAREPVAPKPTSEPAPVCVAVRVTVFADLGGAGTLGCPGCDGQLDDADRLEAAARGVVLPEGLQVVLYRGEEPLEEWPIDLDLDRLSGTVELSKCASGLIAEELSVSVLNLPSAWLGCPSGGKLVPIQAEHAGDLAFVVSYGLTTECPILTPSPPQGSATPVPLPEASATPSPEATAPLQDPSPIPEPQLNPELLPHP